MAEQFLHGADVVAAFQQMGGELNGAVYAAIAGLSMPAARTATRIARCTA
jgi:hypothetical protein